MARVWHFCLMWVFILFVVPHVILALLHAPDIEKVRGKRDHAMLAVLLGCGLRRSELVHLSMDHFQQREDHWAIVDLIGKGGHIRTVPVPEWVKASVDVWTTMAHISNGRIFRCVNKTGSVWGSGITEKVVWSAVKEFAARVGIEQLAPHDFQPMIADVTHNVVPPVSKSSTTMSQDGDCRATGNPANASRGTASDVCHPARGG
jgi:site-specific recombinase XerD